MPFRTVERNDVLHVLPPILPATDVGAVEIDLLICALGYEERTTGVVQALAEQGASVMRALVRRYETNVSDNEARRADLDSGLRQIGAESDWVDGRSETFAAKIEEALASLAPTAVVAIDLSSMKGRLILAVVNAVARHPQCRLLVFYSEAETYFPTHERYLTEQESMDDSGSLGLETGVDKVRVGVDFQGQHTPELVDLVIILSGFSRDRALAAIRYVNPALLTSREGKVLWALGRPHLPQDAWRLDAMKAIHEVSDTDRQVELSTFDYRETVEFFEALCDQEWLISNLSVAPLGSKFQNFGLAVECVVRPEIRVVTASPESYSAHEYTQGVRATWSVDFEDWGYVLNQLSLVGTVVADD